MKDNLFFIAKSGWRTIGVCFAAFVLFTLLDLEFLAALSLFLTLFFLFIYRNPERLASSYEPNAIIAPVDGVVKKIETLQGEDYTYVLEIESFYSSVGVLRFPMQAVLKELKLTHGCRLGKSSSLFGKLNESLSLCFESNSGKKIALLHRLKQSVVPLEVDVQEGHKAVIGSRYGYMINGVSYLYLESDIRLNIKEGELLKAGETLLAYSS
jgi:phosphatidylserine decarboxylase